MTPQDALTRWKTLLNASDDAWHLEEAALTYAAADYPDLSIETCLRQLDEWAEESRAHVGAMNDGGAESAARLCHYLFEVAGFLGDREHYGDPVNSYFNEVLDRKLGIPITLSVVGMAVGRRLGIPLDGVGMPGHFLLRSPDGTAFFDPFGGGIRLTPEECRERFTALFGNRLSWSESYLDPTPKRQILARMLNNLKLTLLQRNDFRRARRIVEYYLVLEPNSEQDRQLLAQLQEWQARLN
jgi:regulator of sirC expression with transglutaminase-like and TPR domain